MTPPSGSEPPPLAELIAAIEQLEARSAAAGGQQYRDDELGARAEELRQRLRSPQEAAPAVGAGPGAEEPSALPEPPPLVPDILPPPPPAPVAAALAADADPLAVSAASALVSLMTSGVDGDILYQNAFAQLWPDRQAESRIRSALNTSARRLHVGLAFARREAALTEREPRDYAAEATRYWVEILAVSLAEGQLDRAALEAFLADFGEESALGAQMLPVVRELEEHADGIRAAYREQGRLSVGVDRQVSLLFEEGSKERGHAEEQVDRLQKAEDEEREAAQRVLRAERECADGLATEKEAAKVWRDYGYKWQDTDPTRIHMAGRFALATQWYRTAEREERTAAESLERNERWHARGQSSEDRLAEARQAYRQAKEKFAAISQHVWPYWGRCDELDAEIGGLQQRADSLRQRHDELVQRLRGRAEERRRLRQASESAVRPESPGAAPFAAGPAGLSLPASPLPGAGSEPGEVYDHVQQQMRQQMDMVRQQREQQRENLLRMRENAGHDFRQSIDEQIAALDAEDAETEVAMQQQQAMVAGLAAQTPGRQEMTPEERAAYDQAMVQAQAVTEQANAMAGQMQQQAGEQMAQVYAQADASMQGGREAERRREEHDRVSRDLRAAERVLDGAEVALMRAQGSGGAELEAAMDQYLKARRRWDEAKRRDDEQSASDLLAYQMLAKEREGQPPEYLQLAQAQLAAQQAQAEEMGLQAQMMLREMQANMPQFPPPEAPPGPESPAR